MSLLESMQRRWDGSSGLAIDGHARISWGELRDRVAIRRGGLRSLGFRPGDVLALQGMKSLEFLVNLLAALGEGLVVLPLNPRAPEAERARLIGLAREHRTVHVIEDVLPDGSARFGEHPEPSADAMLCFTSGTTGRPKGALLSHQAVLADLEALHTAWQWTSSDRLLHALPLFHIHGLVVAQLGALFAGATTVWLEQFDATSVMERLRHDRITVFMGVPTFHHRLLGLPGDAEDLNLRLVTSGSAPLPAEVHRRFHARFGVSIVERYGMTEIGIVLSNPYEGTRKPGSVGLPLPGVRCRITDPATGEDVPAGQPGEVRIAGPTLMRGYLGNPEASAAAIGDGWMHTGDFGWCDEDGYVHLLGRKADLILVGGFNVYPLEVESVLAEHPAVTEVAVVGVPERDLGEIPAALICGSAPFHVLESWLRERLSAYKIPRRWMRADALPRNAMGKVDRTSVRDALARE